MSWRRFCTLLGGLSIESRWVYALAHTGKVIEDEAEAERYFEAWARGQM